MKQGTFIIEFYQPSEKTSLTYLVRTTNGQIVKHCSNVIELKAFLDLNESKIFENGQKQNTKKDN